MKNLLPFPASAPKKRLAVAGRAGVAGLLAVTPLTLAFAAPAGAATQEQVLAQSADVLGGSPSFPTQSPAIPAISSSSTQSEASSGSSASGSSSSSSSSASSSSSSSSSSTTTQRTGFYNGPTGVDVSKWQRPGGVSLNWEKVAAEGQQFAFIKATDGVEGQQQYFVEDSVAAAEAGLLVGSYHKAHPDRSAIDQADEYAAALAERDQQVPADQTLPPVLDIELDNGLTTAQLQKWTKDFLERVEEKTGETPMIYTYRWFWQVPMGNSTDFTQYPLWLAAYQDQAPTSIPGGWDSLTFWQRSSTGRVDGIPTIVDEDTFNGTLDELQALAAQH